MGTKKADEPWGELMEMIPNSAARLFALGVVSIVFGAIASFLTDYHLAKLLVAIGFGLMAAGQGIGERSISAKASQMFKGGHDA